MIGVSFGHWRECVLQSGAFRLHLVTHTRTHIPTRPRRRRPQARHLHIRGPGPPVGLLRGAGAGPPGPGGGGCVGTGVCVCGGGGGGSAAVQQSGRLWPHGQWSPHMQPRHRLLGAARALGPRPVCCVQPLRLRVSVSICCWDGKNAATAPPLSSHERLSPSPQVTHRLLLLERLYGRRQSVAAGGGGGGGGGEDDGLGGAGLGADGQEVAAAVAAGAAGVVGGGGGGAVGEEGEARVGLVRPEDVSAGGRPAVWF